MTEKEAKSRQHSHATRPRAKYSVHEEKYGTRWKGQTRSGVRWEVCQGDALEVVKSIADESFDCIVTSPPYYSLRDYGVEGQIGLEDTVGKYVAKLVEVMSELRRVLRPDGLLFLNLGDTYYSGKGRSHGVDPKSSKRRFGLRPVDRSGGLGSGVSRKSAIGVPWRVALKMINRGWVLRSPIIWHRTHSLPEAVKDRPRRSYEYVFMFAKDRYYYFNRKALDDIKMEEDVWTISARPKNANGIDTAPFPDRLVEQCLAIGCRPQGEVLDPFAGSGTTLRVALQSGRHAVGIDISRDFCKHMVSEIGGRPRCL